jgi:hypothetical protein
VDEVAAKMRAIAVELREHPEHWTQGTWARDKDGKTSLSDGGEAVCWCAFGFLAREDMVGKAMHYLNRVIDPRYHCVPTWNDAEGRTASEVADAFERAALLLESEAKEQP